MLSRKSFTLKLWDRINSHCRKRRLFKDKDSILLAVSGGPDSVMMLDFFAKLAKKRRLDLAVAHLNHKIRGANSDRDEAFVKKLGAVYGLQTVTGTADVPALARRLKISLEHAARRSRYGFLVKLALKKKYSLVATAHHADDHTETVLLNLIRGTEPKGFLGIPVKRPLYIKGARKVFVIRPLLAVTKKEIMAYLKLNRLPHRRDESNEDEKHTRNWLRKTLLPLIEKKQPRFRAHMLELSAKLGRVLQRKDEG
ncbi:MAG: tRNA lysidine(34) synthetase TilS [Elusimicrobia bacterium]|nr:tRNA lysidine(34) synthetase TilS [Elusimicrobiota bacterium]